MPQDRGAILPKIDGVVIILIHLLKEEVDVRLVAALSACPLGRGSKKLGEKCSSANDCAQASCHDQLCTASCKTDADCAAAATKMVCKGNVKSDVNPEAKGTCAAP